MEALRKARSVYIQNHDFETSLSSIDKSQLKNDIQRYVGIALKESTLQNIFANQFVLNVLIVALRDREENNCDVTPVIKAFESLERYILLLVEQPWKPEYKKLKMYGGFYKTRIKSVLLNPEEIFFSAGYIATSEDVMVYKRPIEKESLLSLAFDCKMAAEECRIVADIYSKVKNIGKSLNSVVSERLGNSGMREQHNLLNDRKPLSSEICLHGRDMYDALPDAPALPKRSPLRPGPHRTQMAYESAYATGLEGVIDTAEIYGKGDMQYENPAKYMDIGYMQPVKPPLLSSVAIEDTFPMMDAATEERIPELPQGTCDEHIRESLKLLSQEGPRKSQARPTSSSLLSHGSKSDDWKWLQDVPSNGHIPRTNAAAGVPPHYGQTCTSNQQSVSTYPPGIVRTKPGIYPSGPDMPLSIDEGIQSDFSRYLSPSLQGSFSQVAPPVPEMPHTHNQVAYDAAFRQQGIPQPQSTYTPQIYAPPALDTDSATSSFSSKSSKPPPPIPSRSLKPVLPMRPVRPEDMLDGAPISSSSALHADGANRKGYLSAASDPNTRAAIPAQTSNTEPILRRDRYGAGGKSNSLKYGDEKTSAVYKVAQSRAARSMDMTLTQWECPVCSNINMASDTVCSVCSCRRQAPDKKYSIHQQAKKSCPACTLENDLENTHCSCCQRKLDDLSLSYV